MATHTPPQKHFYFAINTKDSCFRFAIRGIFWTVGKYVFNYIFLHAANVTVSFQNEKSKINFLVRNNIHRDSLKRISVRTVRTSTRGKSVKQRVGSRLPVPIWGNFNDQAQRPKWASQRIHILLIGTRDFGQRYLYLRNIKIHSLECDFYYFYGEEQHFGFLLFELFT